MFYNDKCGQRRYKMYGQYCNHLNCRKNFGPKGYGFGGGAGTLSMDDGKGYKTNPNEVRAVALLLSSWIVEDQCGSLWIFKTKPQMSWTQKNSNPFQVDHKAKAYIAPKKPLVPNNSSSNVTGRLGDSIRNVSCTILSGLSRFKGSRIWWPEAKTKMGRCRHLPKVKLTASICNWKHGFVNRCEKTVFIAEMMRAAGQTFHKSCFTCQVVHHCIQLLPQNSTKL